MFCRHKFGQIEDDGMQYCTKCNKAIAAPHTHIWEIISKEKWSNTRYVEYTKYISQCNICGLLKKEEF